MAEILTLEPEVPGLNLSLAFVLGIEINRHCYGMRVSMKMLIEPRPHHCSPIVSARSQSTQNKYKNEHLVFALEKETASQAVVGFIVWAFPSPKRQGR